MLLRSSGDEEKDSFSVMLIRADVGGGGKKDIVVVNGTGAYNRDIFYANVAAHNPRALAH